MTLQEKPKDNFDRFGYYFQF